MDARDVNGDVDGVRTQAAARDFVSTLLVPVGWEGFVSDYFDRQPLHVSLGPEAFEGWATPHAVRDLIEAGVPWQFRRMPEVYLEGGRVPHDDIVDTYVDMDGREARTPRLGRIRSLMRAGATVNAFGQESHFPKLATLRRRFARAFAAEVEVATFYSQQDHPGLSPHYDCVEIFVLQIQGCKRWHVSSQRVAAPIVGYGEATLYEPQAPQAQLDLEPGDVLYLPRGTFHHACATSAESLHATVAVKLPTYLDMLHALASHAPDSDAIRAYLPLGGGADSLAAKRSFLETLSATVGTDEFDCALDRALRTRAGLWSGR